MYRKSSNLSTTPSQQKNTAGGGGFMRSGRSISVTNIAGGAAGGMKKRSTSGSNFGFRSNLLAPNSAGMPISGDSSGKRKIGQSGAASVRPIGSHFTARTFSANDPRPKNNKEYLDSIIEALIEFLVEIKCPLTVTSKMLRSPTKKEFATIFETTYRLFDPQFKGKNIEEDVPAIFKLLGYPVEIKKSTMITISASNTLSTRLLALNWLRELAKAGLTWDCVGDLFGPDEGENVSPTEPSETFRKVIFDYNVQCYSLYREGQENFEAQDRFLNDFIFRLDAGDGGLDQVHAENARLLDELKLLESSLPERENLLEECQRTELDLQKMDNYLSKTNEFLCAKAISNGEIKVKVDALEQEVKELRREIERKEALIAQQEISPVEVKRMISAKHELHSKIKSLNADGEELEKQQYRIEMEMQRDREKVDRKMAEFKQKSKNVFASSKIDLDPSWKEYLEFDFSPFDPKFMLHYKESLRPGVDLVIQLANKTVHDMKSDVAKHQETVESLQYDLTAAEEGIENYDAQIKELDEKINAIKQGKNGETDRAKQEIQRLKLQYDELAGSKKMSCAEKERQCDALMKEKNEKDDKYKAEVKVWTKFLKDELDLILSHQEFIKDREQETTDLLNKLLEKF